MAIECEKILEVKNLKKYYPVKKGFFKRTTGYVKAVDDVSFSIFEGETLGLVGESGCGKSTTGASIVRLIDATSGSVNYKGNDILNLNNRELRNYRKEMQIVFQDPYASLNPRMTIEDIIGEALDIHRITNTKKDRHMKVCELIQSVGLTPQHLRRYPYEFSGGQRQRIGIARALAVDPKLIIADEPVSALDVSIQAQVINLLQDLQEKLSLTYLFIAHDLSVVKHICNRVAVMYLGKIVEMAPKKELFTNPLHPYTKSLISSIPIPKPGSHKQRILLKGDVPSPVDTPAGCHFHTRCPMVMDVCKKEKPAFNKYNDHYVSCHRIK